MQPNATDVQYRKCNYTQKTTYMMSYNNCVSMGPISWDAFYDLTRA